MSFLAGILPVRGANAVDGHHPDGQMAARPRHSGELEKPDDVVLRVRVSGEGQAEEIQVRKSSGSPRLDTVAIAAVRRWRFTPSQRNKVTATDWIIVPVRFDLQK
jgi:protein TonB